MNMEAMEMTQWFRALAASAEDPCSFPSTHIQLQFQRIKCPLLTSATTRYSRATYTYMQAKHLHTKKVSFFKKNEGEY